MSLEEGKINREAILVQLKKAVSRIEDNTFRGVIFYSNDTDQEGAFLVVKGNTEDRISAVELILNSVATEPSEEAREIMLRYLYQIFKEFFKDRIYKEIADNKFLKGIVY